MAFQSLECGRFRFHPKSARQRPQKGSVFVFSLPTKPGEGIGCVTVKDEDWTKFFVDVVSHEQTAKLAPHQYRPFLKFYGRASETEIETIRVQSKAFSEQWDCQPLPDHARDFVRARERINVGDIALKYVSSVRVPGFMLCAYDRPAQLQVTWEIVCEIATVWLADKEIEERFPTAADPFGLVDRTHFDGIHRVLPLPEKISSPEEKPLHENYDQERLEILRSHCLVFLRGTSGTQVVGDESRLFNALAKARTSIVELSLLLRK